MLALRLCHLANYAPHYRTVTANLIGKAEALAHLMRIFNLEVVTSYANKFCPNVYLLDWYAVAASVDGRNLSSYVRSMAIPSPQTETPTQKKKKEQRNPS